MNIYDIFKQDLENIAKNLGLNPSPKFSVETPKEEKFGDLATNIAIVSAKENNIKPIEFAEKIKEKILNLNYISTLTIDGPGFINVFLKPDLLLKVLNEVIKHGKNFGNSNLGAGQKIDLNLEYVSVNPTGPMHIGHARCAAYGDSLARVFKKAGYKVTEEYYINDAGGQINVLANSVFLRYKEALGETIIIPEGLYPGDYLIPVAEKLKTKYADKLLSMNEDERMSIIKTFAVSEMMDLIRSDLKDLGITHEIFTSEAELNKQGIIDKAINVLDQNGLLYKGVLEKPKGTSNENWEEKEQLIFKSKQFGDDMDRAVKKHDGTNTYFAGDIGYALDKINRNYKQLIFVLGADHIGYIKRLKSIVSALSNNKVECDVKICQLVNFMENGETLKMSKRAGNYITVKDVVDMVGKDVIRIMMLTRKNDISMTFDVAKVKEQSKDNPVFYIQYAHARAKSVIRMCKEELPEAFELFSKEKANINLISSPDELRLIKLIATLPRVIEQSAIHHEPHRVIFYAMDVAAEFHSLWAKGRDNMDLKFIIKQNAELTAARLVLMQAVANVIASALEVCNVEPLEQM